MTHHQALSTSKAIQICHSHHRLTPAITAYIPVLRSENHHRHSLLTTVHVQILHPYFPEDTTVSDENSDDVSINDFHIDPKSETVNRKRALFHVAEIPFDTLAHMVKTYLESIEKDPCKPTWPVPDMDRNQKRNFRRKTDKFKLINGSLRHQHVYVDEKNKTKRGNYVISRILIEILQTFLINKLKSILR